MTFYDRLIRALFLRRRHTGALGSEDSRRAFLRTIALGGATLPFVPGALERIVLSGRPSNCELIMLMGYGDFAKAQAAQKAFAVFVSAPIFNIIEQAPIITNLFDEWPSYQEASGSSPVAPLDLTWGTPKPSNPPNSEVISTFHHGHGRPRHPWVVS